MKYMVMECHPGYAVVLDEEGYFRKVANLQYETGQIVTDIIEMQLPQKKKRSRWMYSLAAMAACLVLVLTSVLQTDRTAYASVYIMINPEVRMDVNRKDVVVGLEGANADGEALIEGYSYEKKDLDLVMDELVDRAIDMGYLHEGGQISLTLDAENDEWIVTHNDALGEHLIEHMKDIMSVTIEVDGEIKQSNVFTIPVTPGGDDYTEDDYGEKTTSSDASAPVIAPAQDHVSTPSDPQASSGTPASSGSDSGYDDNSDDGQTDYGDQSDDDSDDGQTDYDDQSDDSSDDGQSGYESSDDDDD